KLVHRRALGHREYVGRFQVAIRVVTEGLLHSGDSHLILDGDGHLVVEHGERGQVLLIGNEQPGRLHRGEPDEQGQNGEQCLAHGFVPFWTGTSTPYVQTRRGPRRIGPAGLLRGCYTGGAYDPM